MAQRAQGASSSHSASLCSKHRDARRGPPAAATGSSRETPALRGPRKDRGALRADAARRGAKPRSPSSRPPRVSALPAHAPPAPRRRRHTLPPGAGVRPVRAEARGAEGSSLASGRSVHTGETDAHLPERRSLRFPPDSSRVGSVQQLPAPGCPDRRRAMDISNLRALVSGGEVRNAPGHPAACRRGADGERGRSHRPHVGSRRQRKRATEREGARARSRPRR